MISDRCCAYGRPPSEGRCVLTEGHYGPHQYRRAGADPIPVGVPDDGEEEYLSLDENGNDCGDLRDAW